MNKSKKKKQSKPTIPEFGKTWYLVDVSHREETHPWVELNSQRAWEPVSDKEKKKTVHL